jgi:hypothetical protein
MCVCVFVCLSACPSDNICQYVTIPVSSSKNNGPNLQSVLNVCVPYCFFFSCYFMQQNRAMRLWEESAIDLTIFNDR